MKTPRVIAPMTSMSVRQPKLSLFVHVPGAPFGSHVREGIKAYARTVHTTTPRGWKSESKQRCWVGMDSTTMVPSRNKTTTSDHIDRCKRKDEPAVSFALETLIA